MPYNTTTTKTTTILSLHLHIHLPQRTHTASRHQKRNQVRRLFRAREERVSDAQKQPQGYQARGYQIEQLKREEEEKRKEREERHASMSLEETRIGIGTGVGIDLGSEVDGASASKVGKKRRGARFGGRKDGIVEGEPGGEKEGDGGLGYGADEGRDKDVAAPLRVISPRATDAVPVQESSSRKQGASS